ncbi:MAG TPA: hypothetical protein VIT01_04210 [Acidimicrobiales bacterium]
MAAIKTRSWSAVHVSISRFFAFGRSTSLAGFRAISRRRAAAFRRSSRQWIS